MGSHQLAAALASTHPSLICYLPVGDPCVDSAAMISVYCDVGVDIVEVGLPSKNPYLDGPVVADSMRRASSSGEPSHKFSASLSRVDTDRPAIVWMCYPDAALPTINEFIAAGVVDGVMMLDRHQRGDAAMIWSSLRDSDVATCSFVRSQCPDEDVVGARDTDGYVMLQARPGPTGPGTPSVNRIGEDLAVIRAQVQAPVVVGFGIEDEATAGRAMEAGPDGIVVGSACVQAALQGMDTLASLLTTLRQAIGS